MLRCNENFMAKQKEEVACCYCSNYIYYPDQAAQGYHNHCREKDEKNEVNKPQMKQNNPSNEPTGHFTGRCSTCGSNDLWNDNLHYGCNTCGALLA